MPGQPAPVGYTAIKIKPFDWHFENRKQLFIQNKYSNAFHLSVSFYAPNVNVCDKHILFGMRRAFPQVECVSIQFLPWSLSPINPDTDIVLQNRKLHSNAFWHLSTNKRLPICMILSANDFRHVWSVDRNDCFVDRTLRRVERENSSNSNGYAKALNETLKCKFALDIWWRFYSRKIRYDVYRISNLLISCSPFS